MSATTRYDPITVYVEGAKLKRQAQAWARKVRADTGLPLSQPVSAYIRWLIDQDARRRKGGT
ncbi:MAG: hypothetical protein ACYTEZ_00190 [Planctomycetota bacterium]|jgi:hypothetical protein